MDKCVLKIYAYDEALRKNLTSKTFTYTKTNMKLYLQY